ncbi:MAG: hypothetical protein WBL61_07550 [Bryobacteraceae bacterium]
MRRRLLLALPGLGALVAGRAFGQGEGTATPGDNAAPRVSRKTLTKHSGLKAAYKVPKSAAKQAKYLNSLTALLSLTPAQQEQAATIFASAASARVAAHASHQAAHQALSDAVRNNDANAISRTSRILGNLTSQHISNGALANAAFFQILTSDQQSKLSQFQG